jgi:hypothetical protein
MYIVKSWCRVARCWKMRKRCILQRACLVILHIYIQTLKISFFLWYTIISYHLPKNDIISFISYREKNDMIEYHISFSYHLKLAIFYILFINNQSSKHTKRRSQLSLIFFYSNNGHKLTSKRAVKSTQASNLWRENLKLGQKWKMI